MNMLSKYQYETGEEMAIIKSKKSLSGAHVPHAKHTAEMASVEITDIDLVRIPMQQHMGAPCTPLVKAGDIVKVGQKIGDSEQYFSAPIHASCSGTVQKVEEYLATNGAKVNIVLIENDKQYTVDESIQAPEVFDRESMLTAIQASGLVGLGGAGFPVHVKLGYKEFNRLKTLVINAAECEPYITADYRECLENAKNMKRGIRAIQQHLGIQQVYVGIESNKPKALAYLDEQTADQPSVHIVELKQIYPQGAEKSIIYATTGITVPEGKLPADCGVLVMNISSVSFLGSYLKHGMPLVKKRITVDGNAVKKPQNLIVPIGTPIRDVLTICETNFDDIQKVLMGGPMMGIAVSDLDMPVIKNNNAILAFDYNEVKQNQTTACIRCGSCVHACPMKLMPTGLEKAYDQRDLEALQELRINLCINCGCCTYVCPAKRQLAQKNQLAKVFARKQEVRS